MSDPGHFQTRQASPRPMRQIWLPIALIVTCLSIQVGCLPVFVPGNKSVPYPQCVVDDSLASSLAASHATRAEVVQRIGSSYSEPSTNRIEYRWYVIYDKPHFTSRPWCNFNDGGTARQRSEEYKKHHLELEGSAIFDFDEGGRVQKYQRIEPREVRDDGTR